MKRGLCRKAEGFPLCAAPEAQAGAVRFRSLLALGALLFALCALPLVLASPRFAEVRKAPLSISSYKKVFASRNARAISPNPTPVGSTYTWNVASGAWTSSGSWTPARTAPAVDDILVFDGSTQATPTVTLVPRETVGRLRIINSASVTLSSSTATSGAGTIARSGSTVTGTGTSFTTFFAVGDFLFTGTNSNVSQISAITNDTSLTTVESGTISAATGYSKAPMITITGNGPGLDIPSGGLVISSTTPTVLKLPAGATGSVTGSINDSGAPHPISVTDASGLTFNSGSVLTQGTGGAGNIFGGSGTANTVIFASGSTFIQKAGSNPFALAQPNSKVNFQTGSLFSFQQNAAPSFSGRTYANLEINFASFSQSGSGGNTLSIDNLTITAGTLNLGMTGTFNLKGNVSVASGATLNFNAASPATISLNGTSAQTISNSGTLTIGSNETVSLTNSNGATLTSGTVTLNGALATSATFTNSGTVNVSGGTVQLNQGGSITGNALAYSGTSALVYAGTTSQTTTSVEFPSLGGPTNLTINNGGGVTLHAARTVSGTLTLTSGTFTIGSNLTMGAGTTISRAAGSLSGTPTFGGNINLTYTGSTVTTTGTEVPSSGNVNLLTVNNTGGVTLGSNMKTNNSASIGGGAVFSTGAFTYTDNGGVANSGTINVSSGGTFVQDSTFTNSGTTNVAGTYQIDFGSILPGTNALIYSSGSTLLFNNASAYNLENNSWPSTNGPPNVTVNSGTAGITLTAARTVSGTFQYAAGVTNAANLTLNGTAQVNNGGFLSGSPTYGSSSLLKYNVNGSYGRNGEWLPGATSGAGYPANVQLSNNTNLDLPNGSTSSVFQLSGILTIDSGSTLNMGAMTQALTVVGNVANSGTLTLSSASGGNLNVGGNLTTTTFTSNGRTLTFNGGSAQSWTDSTGGQNFGAVVINNSSTGVTLNSAISVSSLTLTSGKVTTTSSNLLTVTGTAAGAVSGGSSSSYVNGPLARILPASLASGSTYSFPVGKGGFNQFDLVNPTTTSGGTVTFQAEEFDGNSGGTAGTGLNSLNTDRYWGSSITSGAANFTNTAVKLTNSSALSASNRIGKSSTANGTYNSIGGTFAGSTITSDPITSFSFFNIGTGGQTISGTLFDASGNPITTGRTIKLIQNGTVSGTTATSNGSGVYTFTGITLANGDRIATFISGASEKGATVTVSGNSPADITNFDIKASQLTVRNDNGATSITNTNLADADSSKDSDVPFTVVTGALSTTTGTSLQINFSSTYAPGGNTSVGGNWINNGTFTAGSNTVTLNGAANQTIGGSNNSFFNSLTINNAGTSPNNAVSLGLDTNIGGVLTISGGVFDQGASFNLFTTGSATNVVSVGAGATWRNIGTGDLTLSSGVSNSGTISFNGGGTSCGDADTIVIRSSVNGTARTWSGTGTFSMIDVDVADQKVPALPPPAVILVNSGTNSGGNTGWTFVDQCTSGTYTWIGGTTGAATDWTIPTNWSPTRLTPAVGDTLIFDGNSTPGPTVTNVPTQTVAAVRLTNGVNPVTLSTSGANQLTLNGSTGNDFSVPATTALILSGSNALKILVSGSGQGSVAGTINLVGGAHRLLGGAGSPNPAAISFASGSIFAAGSLVTTGFSGNPFGATTDGSVGFQSGSSANFNEGSDPFGGSGHSVVTFNLGSSQTFSAASAFSSDGRSYGNLILDNTQNYSGSGSGVLTIQNDLTIKVGSALTLSSTSGGDLNLLGNFTDQSTAPAAFNANGRTVKFQGGSLTQTVGKSSVAENFGDVIISKTGGSVKLSGSVGLTITGALQFQGTSSAVDVFEFGSKTLNFNGTFTDSSGAAANGFKGDLTGSTLAIGGAGALGTLNFVSGAQTLSSMTMNRTSSGSVTLGTNLTIGSNLSLTNGIVNTANTLSLGSSATAAHTNGYVIGNLQKSFGASGNLGNFTFPVGAANAYSPLDANVTANLNGTLTVKAVQGPQPNISGPNALQRYWTLSGSGLTANLTFHYSTSAPNDVVGTEANYLIFKYNGGFTHFTPDATGVNSAQDHFATLNNVSSFSDWTLAEATAVSPPTLVVNTTDDQDFGSCQPAPGHCSLREAINVANGDPDTNTINFDIPTSAPGHFYYATNNGAGVSAANVTATVAALDSSIADIDPDWPHSWWSIKPTSALPAIINPLMIDGYSQRPCASNSSPCSSANTQTATDDAVLTIELNGVNAGGNTTTANGKIEPKSTVDGLTANALSSIQGLAVNRFSGNGLGLLSGSSSNFNNFSTVSGNFIGTDVSGTLAAANGLSGLLLNVAGFQQVGCTVPAERNLISGNTGEGVEVLTSNGNFIQGNFIGVAADGVSLLGNGGHGIEIYSSSGNNLIGVAAFSFQVSTANRPEVAAGCQRAGAFAASAKPDSGASDSVAPMVSTFTGANVIAGNTGDGVRVSSATDTGDRISQNSIFSNGRLGINLVGGTENSSGVTANDPGDSDSGPNNLQNFPVITSAVVGTTHVTGTLDSYTNGTFTIEIFSNSACDASGYGEGKTFLGSAQTTSTATPGQYAFDVTVPTLVSGQILTATATDEVSNLAIKGNLTPTVSQGGNTSEFSQCFTVPGPSISGHVSYCITPSASVPNVLMSVTGSQTTSTTTDSSGNYGVTLTAGGNYTITPSKSALSVGAAGINTVDVIAAQRHFLGVSSLSGCAFTAADANEDSTVDTIDVIAIQRFYLGLNSGTANTGQWRFNPASQGYSNLATDQSGQNYNAITLGDINGDLTPTRANLVPDALAGGQQIAPSAVATVSLPTASISTSDTNVTFPVKTTAISSSDNLIGFQGKFTFDSSVVTFQATPASPAGLTATNWNVSANIQGAGTIKTLVISAFSTDNTPLSGSGTLFNLNFTRVSSTGGASTPLTWAAPPDNFVFIDTSLATQAPGSTPAGSITITGGPTASFGDVSGRIVDANGKPVEGAAVRMSGAQNRLTVSDAQGNYRFENVETNGFYTVTPSRANFAFSPTQRSFSQLSQHTEAAFNADSTGDKLNPLDRSEYFVRQQYVDFLNREPDEAGLNFWYNNIEACGPDAQCREAKRIDTSAAFFVSIEFQQTGYLVYRTYQSAYGSLTNTPVPLRLGDFKPDTAAIRNGVIVNQSGWQQVLESNTQAFMRDFVQRARFTAAYPAALTPAEFVDKLFANAAVTPAGNERLAAINQFGAATNSSDADARARALRMVAENATLVEQQFDSAFVLMQYFGYLRRDPDAAPDTDFSGYHYWLMKLENFKGNYSQAEMVKAFLTSSEYLGRFPR